MPWVKIDDHFDEHPKMQKVGPIGWGFWLAGIAYCNRNLTDGFIPWSKARTLCSFEIVEDDGMLWELGRNSGHAGEDLTADWVISLLIDAGLWEEVGNGNGRIEGYLIHDYPEYQPTRAQVEEEKAKKVAAGQAGGQASAQARAQAKSNHAVKQNPTAAQAKSNPVPVPVPVPSSSYEPNGSTELDNSFVVPKAKRKHRIPDDWTPSDHQRASLADSGFSVQEIDAEAVKFVNHHVNKGDTGLAWDRAFANWMDNSRAFAKSKSPTTNVHHIQRLPQDLVDRRERWLAESREYGEDRPLPEALVRDIEAWKAAQKLTAIS